MVAAIDEIDELEIGITYGNTFISLARSLLCLFPLNLDLYSPRSKFRVFFDPATDFHHPA